MADLPTANPSDALQNHVDALSRGPGVYKYVAAPREGGVVPNWPDDQLGVRGLRHLEQQRAEAEEKERELAEKGEGAAEEEEEGEEDPKDDGDDPTGEKGRARRGRHVLRPDKSKKPPSHWDDM